MSSPRNPKPVSPLVVDETSQRLAWHMIKRVLVREAMIRTARTSEAYSKVTGRELVACFVNQSKELPDIGRRVDKILRQTGVVYIYFDDGSFVSASVQDPQPATNEEAAVVERIYGTPTKPKSCGCKTAVCKHAMTTVDMVAAVSKGSLLRAMDKDRRDAKNPSMWRFLLENDRPFDLWLLHDVPLGLATVLADFGSRSTRFSDGGQAWGLARRYAEGRPFRRV